MFVFVTPLRSRASHYEANFLTFVLTRVSSDSVRSDQTRARSFVRVWMCSRSWTSVVSRGSAAFTAASDR